MNNILVTGANGFVGQNLLPYLENQGFNILTLGREKQTGTDLSWQHLEEIATADVNTIVHLAGKAHDLKNVSKPEDYYQINYDLTKRLYDQFLKSDAKKFIFMSSIKAAADVVDGILTEENNPAPQTHYGKSKLLAEQYIQEQALANGKSYYILRPCMIHGPKNKGNLNLLYQFVEKNIPYPLAAFHNKRSFLSISNLCFVIDALIKNNQVSSGIYHIADDEPLSTREVVEILAKSLGKKPSLLAIPPKIINYLAKIGDIFKLPLNSERLTKLTENYVVDNGKIRNAIGSELPTKSREGLMLTANSFRE